MTFSQGTSQAITGLSITGAGRLGFYIDYSELSAAGTHRFYVTRTHGTTGTVSCTLTTSGDTHTTGTANLTWADGEADVKYVDVPVTASDVSIHGNGDHRIYATLSSPTNGAALQRDLGTIAHGVIDNGTIATSNAIFVQEGWGGTASGTLAEPYATWAQVVAAVSDTTKYIYIRGLLTQFNETSSPNAFTVTSAFGTSRTSANRLTIRNWPGYTGGIDGTGNNDCLGFLFEDGLDYLTFRNLTVSNFSTASGTPSAGFRSGPGVAGSYRTTERCVIDSITDGYGAATGGIYVGSVGNEYHNIWACSFSNTEHVNKVTPLSAIETYDAKAWSVQRNDFGTRSGSVYQKQQEDASVVDYCMSIKFNKFGATAGIRMSTQSIGTANRYAIIQGNYFKDYNGDLSTPNALTSLQFDSVSSQPQQNFWVVGNISEDPVKTNTGFPEFTLGGDKDDFYLFNNIYINPNNNILMSRTAAVGSAANWFDFWDYNYYTTTPVQIYSAADSASGISFAAAKTLTGGGSNYTVDGTTLNTSSIPEPDTAAAGVGGTEAGVYLTGVEIIGPVGLQEEGPVVSLQGTSQAITGLSITGAGRLGFYIDYSELSDPGTHRFYVTRTHGTTGAVGCTLTTSGDTHTTGTANLTWADGEADVKYVDVPVTSGNLSTHEGNGLGDHRVVATLSSATGGAAIHNGDGTTRAYGVIDTGAIASDANAVFYDSAAGTGSGTAADPYGSIYTAIANAGSKRYLYGKGTTIPDGTNKTNLLGDGDPGGANCIDLPATRTSEATRLFIQNWPGNTWTVTGNGGTSHKGFSVEDRDVDYQTLRGITFTDLDCTTTKSNGCALYLAAGSHCSFISVERCTSSDINGSANQAMVRAQSADNLKIWACTSDGVRKNGVNSENCSAIALIYECKNVSVQRCKGSNSDSLAFDKRPNDGSAPALSMRFCTNGLNQRKLFSMAYGAGGTAYYWSICQNNVIAGLVVDEPDVPNKEDNPIGIFTGSGTTTNDLHHWSNNTFYYSGYGENAAIDTRLDNVIAYNNLYYDARISIFDRVNGSGNFLYLDYEQSFRPSLSEIYWEGSSSTWAAVAAATTFADNISTADPNFVDTVDFIPQNSDALTGGVGGTERGYRLTGVEIIGPVGLQRMVINSAINQLPAANYTPAKFSMEAVSPRPDAESDLSGGAYYRYYHADMSYKARVAVRGGAWPLHYDLTTAPAGATIGNNYGDDDYGVISWASPTGALETFTVTVTDQEGASLVVTWTATLDESKFVFVDADIAGPGTGTGTFTDPLSDIDAAQTGHANKIAVLRGSTAQYAPTASFRLGNTTYPSTLMGFPGESPIVDGAGGKVTANDDDISVINIIFDGSVVQDEVTATNHAIWRDVGERFLLWNCTFRNQDVGAGGVGISNPACLFAQDIGPLVHTYIAVVDCTQEASSMTAFTTLFTTERVLIENNFLGDSDLDAIPVDNPNTFAKIHLKDDASKVSVRANSIIAPSHNGVVISISQQGNDEFTTDQEVCWNTIVAGSTNQTYNSGLISWGVAGALSDYQTVPNMYQYRNSVTNKYNGNTQAHIARYAYAGEATADQPYPVTVEDELWFNGGYDTINVNGNSSTLNSYAGTSDVTSDELQRFAFGAVQPVILGLSDVDANGLLTGAERTTYFGTVGAEVVIPIYATPQLPASNYIPAKQAAHLIHPRPDSETASWAKHRKHYPGLKYEVPIGVSFGSWPFFYDLTTAPTGATIGENVVEVDGRLVPGDDYGVVTWDNPTVGSHTFQVTVSFQDGATPLVIDWTLKVTTAGTIFVDAVGGSDTNDGVLVVDGGTGPLKTIDGWYKASKTDRTYTGYQVCYLAGTYDIYTADTAESNDLIMNYLNKPLVHYAKNVESVVWNFQKHFKCGFTATQPGTGDNEGEYNFHDWFLGRITCSGGDSSRDNCRRWSIFGSARSSWPYDGTEGACRNTWFKSPQIDWTANGTNADNSAIAFGWDTSVETPGRIYFYVTQCPITNITSTQATTNFNGWWVGQTAYFLAEHNVITNTNFGRGPYSGKSSEYRSCYRNIDMSAAPDQSFVPDCAGSYAIGYGGGSELSYSKINYTDTDTVATAVQWGHHFETFDDDAYPNHEKNWQFRNSVSKAPSTNGECFRSGSWPTEVIQDIWCSKDDGIYGDGPSNAQLDGDWQLYTVADDPFDSSMNLTSIEFFGTHGAELSSSIAWDTVNKDFSGLTDGQNIGKFSYDTNIQDPVTPDSKKFGTWGEKGRGTLAGYGTEGDTGITRGIRTSSARLSCAQGWDGLAPEGPYWSWDSESPDDYRPTTGQFGGAIGFSQPLVKGQTMHCGFWIYIPSDADLRTDAGFLKMLRFMRSDDAGARKMEIQPTSDETTGELTGWNLQDESFITPQSNTRRDSSRVLIKGQWNFIAFSAYLSDVSSELIKRLWVNDELAYEQLGETDGTITARWYNNGWQTDNFTANFRTLSSAADTVNGMMLFTYWNGGTPTEFDGAKGPWPAIKGTYPVQDQNFNVDSIVVHSNEADLGTDAFGNKYITSTEVYPTTSLSIILDVKTLKFYYQGSNIWNTSE